ncbi:MAG: PucR family transcriptional regulator [Peptococcaceae bacterium]
MFPKQIYYGYHLEMERRDIMTIQLEIICGLYEKYTPSGQILSMQLKQQDAVIKGVVLYQKEVPLSEEFLYLLQEDDLEELDVDFAKTYSFLCIGQNILEKTAISQTNSNLIVIQSDAKLYEIFYLLQKIVSDYEIWKSQLWRKAVESNSIPSIFKSCTKYLDFPFLLVDANLRIIARSEEGAFEESEELNQLWQADYFPSYIAPMNSTAAGFLSRYTYKQNMNLKFFSVELILFNLVALEKKCGTLVLLNWQGKVQDYHIVIANNIIDIFAQVMVLHKYYQPHYENPFDRLLVDILNDKKVFSKQIEEQLSYIGWNMDDYFYFIKFKRLNDTKEDLSFSHLGETLEHLIPNSRYLKYDRVMFYIVNRSKNNMIYYKDIEKKIYQIIKNYEISVGISNTFKNFEELYNCKNQPDLAVEYGMPINPHDKLYSYEVYMLYHMIDICATVMDVRTLIHPSVKLLWEHDEKNGSDYVQTLQAYLHYDRAVQRGADFLYIHKNTFTYRMNKIEKLIGTKISDEFRITYLLISCTIVKYLQKYKKN